MSQGRLPVCPKPSGIKSSMAPRTPGPVLVEPSCVLVTRRSFPNCRLPSSTRSIASWAINPTAKRTTGPRKPQDAAGQDAFRAPPRLSLPRRSLKLSRSHVKTVVASKRNQGTRTSSGKRLRSHCNTPSSASRDPHHAGRTAWVTRTFSPAASACPPRRSHRDESQPGPSSETPRGQAGRTGRGLGTGRAVPSSAESRPWCV